MTLYGSYVRLHKMVKNTEENCDDKITRVILMGRVRDAVDMIDTYTKFRPDDDDKGMTELVVKSVGSVGTLEKTSSTFCREAMRNLIDETEMVLGVLGRRAL